MYEAAQTVSEKIANPGLTYSGAPIAAFAWGIDSVSFVPDQIREFCAGTVSQQRSMNAAVVEIPEALLVIANKLGRPRPRRGFTIGNLLDLISDGRHGSATTVDSTISRCNDVTCELCGGLWQGTPWVLSANGSLPMPIPGDIPGHYMALPELIVSTVANGRQASWRPSDLIEEAIHGIAFCRRLHVLSLDSPAFVEVSISLTKCSFINRALYKLAAHCCVDISAGADFLLVEFRRKLQVYLKKCGLQEGMGLVCDSCSTFKACLTMAYCNSCDRNFCASPRPDDDSGYLGTRCFELHACGCNNAVAKFPRMRCADLDWSELGDDGKMRNSGVAIGRKVLETKLKLERQWHKRYKGLKKAELLEKVLQIVR